MRSFCLFAYDHPEAPLGKVFHSELHAALCWEGAKGLARDSFNKAIESMGDTSGKHIVGQGFWIYRYEFMTSRAELWAHEAMARILSGDYCDKVDEMEVTCIWYEQHPDGSKFICKSPKGQNDPSPDTKRIGKYGKTGTAQGSSLL